MKNLLRSGVAGLFVLCLAGTVLADEPDALHISETVGAKGLPITKPELTGHDVEGTDVQEPVTPDLPIKTPPPRNISLNHGNPQPGVETGMYLNPQGKFGLLAYWPLVGDQPLTVQRVDLGRADVDKVIPLDVNMVALAISPDGKRMITRSNKEFYPLTRWRVDLWALEDSKAKPLLSFRAYDPADNGADTVSWASYLDATHLMTCSASHTLTLWQISDTAVKEIYTQQGDDTCSPHMSSGGKYVILGSSGQILVSDAMTGKIVAKCTAFNDGGRLVCSLRPDVQKLALAGEHRLVICDLKNDRLLLDVGLPAAVTGLKIDWIDPHLVLIDNMYLFDVDHHAMLWQYAAPDIPLAEWMGERLAYQAITGEAFAGGPGHCYLNSFTIPDDKVKLAYKHLVDGQFVLQPGMTVSLEVNGIDGNMRQKIIDKLTQRLTDAGLSVGDNQPIKLVAESKNVDQHDITYRSHGLGGQTESVTVSDTIQSLSFVMDSKPLWSTDSFTIGSAPMFIFRDKGQSINDAVNDLNKPKLDWFLNTGIPRSLLKPADPAGTSDFGQIGGRTRNAR